MVKEHPGPILHAVGRELLAAHRLVVLSTTAPVPYTDRYEITIEQTFQTHVPAPVLVDNDVNIMALGERDPVVASGLEVEPALSPAGSGRTTSR